jgi:hypothetical protein
MAGIGIALVPELATRAPFGASIAASRRRSQRVSWYSPGAAVFPAAMRCKAWPAGCRRRLHRRPLPIQVRGPRDCHPRAPAAVRPPRSSLRPPARRKSPGGRRRGLARFTVALLERLHARDTGPTHAPEDALPGTTAACRARGRRR